MRLPRATPPTPTRYDFDVVISMMVGIPTTGTLVRSQPTGGSEFQVIVLAEALAATGLKVGIVSGFFAYAYINGVQYIPSGEVIGRTDSWKTHRPTAQVRTKVVISERFGDLPGGLEFERVVFDLHDLPDGRLGRVVDTMRTIPESRVVTHSQFANDLLVDFPNKSVIPCMLPDEFYDRNYDEFYDVPRATPSRTARSYIYGSAALKGLEPTLALWRELKKSKNYHFKKATLTITSPGYDGINPELLKDQKDVIVHTGLSPAGMQQLLAASDGIFMVSTYCETFGIVMHQCEVAGKPCRVLRLAGEDALDQTLATPDTLFTEATPFIGSFEAGEAATGRWDFSVSTILPKWLDVLGFAKQQEKAA